MEKEEDVVIVGGGIAGLATALALKKVGVRTLVLESSRELRATGAALTLFPNAWRALDALGVSDKLTSIYAPIKKGYVTNVANGAVQEVSYSGVDRSGNGPRAVHRSALLEALAEELPIGAIRFSSKLKSIQNLLYEGSSIAVLTLDDGTVIKAKVVIGCDGVHSVVARWLGLKDPIHSGRAAVRALAVFPEGHGLNHEVQQFVDGGSRAGIVPLNDKELYWFVTCKSASNTDKDRTMESPELIQKSVLENLANFPPIFLNVVHHSDLHTLSLAPLLFRVPWNILLNDMYKENITVAGDAMHPTTPDLGQGGCSSLEDAIVLGRHIGNTFLKNGEIGSEALKGYVEERRWRAAFLISASYLSGRIQQGGSGWLMKFLRDKVFYKFFYLLTASVVQYNCGLLPNCLKVTADENTKPKYE